MMEFGVHGLEEFGVTTADFGIMGVAVKVEEDCRPIRSCCVVRMFNDFKHMGINGMYCRV